MSSERRFNSAFARQDYGSLVSSGLYGADHMGIGKFGSNPDIDTAAEETIWTQGGMYVQPSGAETLNVVSSSTNDASAGTGGISILIDGLDSDYNEITEVVNLNGTTNVLTAESYIAVNGVTVISSGSSGYNEGNISLTQSSSSVVLCHVPTTAGVSQQSIFTIKAGYVGYLKKVYFNGSKSSGGQDPLVLFHNYIYNPAANTRYNTFSVHIDANHTNTILADVPFGIAIPEKCTITMTAETDQNGTACFCFYNIEVKKEGISIMGN